MVMLLRRRLVPRDRFVQHTLDRLMFGALVGGWHMTTHDKSITNAEAEATEAYVWQVMQGQGQPNIHNQYIKHEPCVEVHLVLLLHVHGCGVWLVTAGVKFSCAMLTAFALYVWSFAENKTICQAMGCCRLDRRVYTHHGLLGCCPPSMHAS